MRDYSLDSDTYFILASTNQRPWMLCIVCSYSHNLRDQKKRRLIWMGKRKSSYSMSYADQISRKHLLLSKQRCAYAIEWRPTKWIQHWARIQLMDAVLSTDRSTDRKPLRNGQENTAKQFNAVKTVFSTTGSRAGWWMWDELTYLGMREVLLCCFLLLFLQRKSREECSLGWLATL